MRVLVTGANGMLGEKCTQRLNNKHQVFATDVQENLIYDSPVNYSQLDITEFKQVEKMINQIKPEVVVNCAAYTDVDGSEDNKKLAKTINVNGVHNLIEAVEQYNTHIIHISTDYVFDGSHGPYEEDDEINPINYYGQTKYDSEKLLIKSNLPVTIIRTNVLFGNTQSKGANFVHWVIDNLRNGNPIKVVNDQFGNPTWVDSLAEVTEKIIDKKLEGIYHYGGEDYLSRFEFALEIADVFALDNKLIKKVTTRALNQKAARPYKAGLISDKLQNSLDIKLYSIKDALKEMKSEIEEIEEKEDG
ncbi:MAG: dTDP-4-dehydrorhamnose reductase [Candidatus Marinimicrobia bacterium]|nr:dTDP-4-dehydrorhamnose reductase [Candidatus Neomarinimicrobiota bacterium]